MPASKNFSAEQLYEMERAYTVRLMSCADIAACFSCGKNTVRKYLLLRGVALDKRPRTRAKAKGRESPLKGTKLTDLRKQALSESRKGNSYCLGRKLSAETRAKISAGNRGKTVPREAVERQRASAAKRRVSEDPALQRVFGDLAASGAFPSGASEYEKNLIAIGEQRKATVYARAAVKRMLRRVLKMSGKKKNTPSEVALGYSSLELREHMESQFVGEMRWGVKGSFHIDHIVPVSVFFASGVFDPKIINALANLRPLTPEDNRAKSDKYDVRKFNDDLRALSESIKPEEARQ